MFWRKVWWVMQLDTKLSFLFQRPSMSLVKRCKEVDASPYFFASGISLPLVEKEVWLFLFCFEYKTAPLSTVLCMLKLWFWCLSGQGRLKVFLAFSAKYHSNNCDINKGKKVGVTVHFICEAVQSTASGTAPLLIFLKGQIPALLFMVYTTEQNHLLYEIWEIFAYNTAC